MGKFFRRHNAQDIVAESSAAEPASTEAVAAIGQTAMPRAVRIVAPLRFTDIVFSMSTFGGNASNYESAFSQPISEPESAAPMLDTSEQ